MAVETFLGLLVLLTAGLGAFSGWYFARNWFFWCFALPLLIWAVSRAWSRVMVRSVVSRTLLIGGVFVTGSLSFYVAGRWVFGGNWLAITLAWWNKDPWAIPSPLVAFLAVCASVVGFATLLAALRCRKYGESVERWLSDRGERVYDLAQVLASKSALVALLLIGVWLAVLGAAGWFLRFYDVALADGTVWIVSLESGKAENIVDFGEFGTKFVAPAVLAWIVYRLLRRLIPGKLAAPGPNDTAVAETVEQTAVSDLPVAHSTEITETPVGQEAAPKSNKLAAIAAAPLAVVSLAGRVARHSAAMVSRMLQSLKGRLLRRRTTKAVADALQAGPGDAEATQALHAAGTDAELMKSIAAQVVALGEEAPAIERREGMEALAVMPTADRTYAERAAAALVTEPADTSEDGLSEEARFRLTQLVSAANEIVSNDPNQCPPMLFAQLYESLSPDEKVELRKDSVVFSDIGRAVTAVYTALGREVPIEFQAVGAGLIDFGSEASDVLSDGSDDVVVMAGTTSTSAPDTQVGVTGGEGVSGRPDPMPSNAEEFEALVLAGSRISALQGCETVIEASPHAERRLMADFVGALIHWEGTRAREALARRAIADGWFEEIPAEFRPGHPDALSGFAEAAWVQVDECALAMSPDVWAEVMRIMDGQVPDLAADLRGRYSPEPQPGDAIGGAAVPSSEDTTLNSRILEESAGFQIEGLDDFASVTAETTGSDDVAATEAMRVAADDMRASEAAMGPVNEGDSDMNVSETTVQAKFLIDAAQKIVNGDASAQQALFAIALSEAPAEVMNEVSGLNGMAVVHKARMIVLPLMSSEGSAVATKGAVRVVGGAHEAPSHESQTTHHEEQRMQPISAIAPDQQGTKLILFSKDEVMEVVRAAWDDSVMASPAIRYTQGEDGRAVYLLFADLLPRTIGAQCFAHHLYEVRRRFLRIPLKNDGRSISTAMGLAWVESLDTAPAIFAERRESDGKTLYYLNATLVPAGVDMTQFEALVANAADIHALVKSIADAANALKNPIGGSVEQAPSNVMPMPGRPLPTVRTAMADEHMGEEMPAAAVGGRPATKF